MSTVRCGRGTCALLFPVLPSATIVAHIGGWYLLRLGLRLFSAL